MIAIDTNVLLYLIDTRESVKCEQAKHAFAGVRRPVILWQVANEFLAMSPRIGCTRSESWSYLSAFVEAGILAMPSAAVHEWARDLHTNRQVAIWDALIYAACIDAGVHTIYSEDLPGSAIPNLRIINPFATGTTT
jgi:predicted nucleic acid-binding protein